MATDNGIPMNLATKSIILAALWTALGPSKAQPHGVAKQSLPYLLPQEKWEAPVRPVLQVNCKGDHFRPVTSVATLPSDVRQAILRDGPIADHGERYQAGDVIIEKLPLRRLAVVAWARSRMFVAIEDGGGRGELELWTFARLGDQWRDLQLDRIAEAAPTSLQELLYQVCDGYPKPSPRPLQADLPPL